MDLRSLPQVQQHNFSRVAQADIARSTFNRSHRYATTFDASKLIPFYVDETLPGDTFQMNVTAISRLLSPLEHPIMDNLHLDFFFFSCPNRLLWDNWTKFQGEQVDPGDSIDFTIPQLQPATSFSSTSLMDYMGLRMGITGVSVSALPFRMYSKVWNEWFRDQNLQDSLDVPTDDGPDLDSEYDVQKRNKRPDYFTSALPWPQKSGDAVSIPLGTSADVLGIGKETQTFTSGSQAVYESDDSNPTYTIYNKIEGGGTTHEHFYVEGSATTGYPRIYADLSNASAATINEWREAFQLQRLLERDARGGTRYCEIIQSHFDVTDPMHAVLQRSEYIGGGSCRVGITPVAQTSEDGTSDQGTLAAVGYSEKSGITFTKSFTEHCTLLGLVCLRGDVNYQQGHERMWNRLTRYDFYMPALAHLGEQEILNKELYVQGNSADDEVFGYQERWAEMRTKRSYVTGKLRSDFGASLDVWHLAPDFSALPVLNSSFIEDETPLDRCVKVPSEHHLIFDAWLDLKCTRPLPTFSVPGMIDHF